jgi:hypothetical protein
MMRIGKTTDAGRAQRRVPRDIVLPLHTKCACRLQQTCRTGILFGVLAASRAMF